MKTKPRLRPLTLFASLAVSASLQALEIHEWGTFTVLVSSSGQTVNWYQPYSDIAKLPIFVQGDLMRMKSSIKAASVRMETPVIYFYPEKEMPISVRVAFANGSITERFPSSTNESFPPAGTLGLNLSPFITCVAKQPTSEDIFGQRLGEFTTITQPIVTRWTGKLLPPDHADAKLIPAVDSASDGEHYAAARNVPDAWIFHSDAPNPYSPNIQPVEKFIFYRGAGQSIPPYSSSMSDDQSVTFNNYSQSGSTFQVALRVRDGKASWKQMPNIAGPAENATRSTSVTFPEKTISLKQADQELRVLFLSELISHGLTKDEAQAMIDTWNQTWFAEPGQRIFTIVDRTWVDSVLPLGITPEPQNIERVFVARFEILAPADEKQIRQILSHQTTPEQAGRQLAALELGRFQNGAIELVADQIKRESIDRFQSLAQAKITPINTGK